MSEQPIHTLHKHVNMTLNINNAPSHATYGKRWSLVSKYVNSINCEPEWKPFITFCLMWTATLARECPLNCLARYPEYSNIKGEIRFETVIKLRSKTKPDNYEFKYDSRRDSQIRDIERIHFKIEISDQKCNLPLVKLIDKFRSNLPYELEDLPCKTFLTPFNLTWDKSEDPYILKFKN